MLVIYVTVSVRHVVFGGLILVANFDILKLENLIFTICTASLCEENLPMLLKDESILVCGLSSQTS